MKVESDLLIQSRNPLLQYPIEFYNPTEQILGQVATREQIRLGIEASTVNNQSVMINILVTIIVNLIRELLFQNF